MAGEHIEDLTIDLLRMDNNTLEQRCNFLPSKMKNIEIEEMLSNSM